MKMPIWVYLASVLVPSPPPTLPMEIAFPLHQSRSTARRGQKTHAHYTRCPHTVVCPPEALGMVNTCACVNIRDCYACVEWPVDGGRD